MQIHINQYLLCVFSQTLETNKLYYYHKRKYGNIDTIRKHIVTRNGVLIDVPIHH